MPVSDKHELYIKNISKWQTVRDCVEGSDAIKESRGNGGSGLYGTAGTKYLPAPNAADASQENTDRYQAYKTRANFVNFTGQTKEGLNGMITRQKSTVELETSIEHLEDNADGAGLSLQELIQRIIGDVQETGRYGLLVDFPLSAEGQTQAQTSGLVSSLKRYPAESIINWRCSTINGITQLTMVVLAEAVEVISVDGFGIENVTHHRVLQLIDGVYIQQMYDEDDKLIGEEITPRQSNGASWDFIPFQFVGSIDNSASPDKAILYDIAEVNIAHYRNSADFEESSFFVGQPTPVIAGLTQAWVDSVLKGGVQIGSRTAILLPDGASASLLQASTNSMPEIGMAKKEEQMVKIGAKIITDSSGQETAETSKIRFAGQNSKLGTLVLNVESAIKQVLEWSMLYMGGSGENIVEINKQFYEATINPQLIIAQIQLADRGIIAHKDIRDSMRKAGSIAHDRTDEEIDAEISLSSPLI